jgi:hypothetical protein
VKTNTFRAARASLDSTRALLASIDRKKSEFDRWIDHPSRPRNAAWGRRVIKLANQTTFEANERDRFPRPKATLGKRLHQPLPFRPD